MPREPVVAESGPRPSAPHSEGTKSSPMTSVPSTSNSQRYATCRCGVRWRVTFSRSRAASATSLGTMQAATQSSAAVAPICPHRFAVAGVGRRVDSWHRELLVGWSRQQRVGDAIADGTPPGDRLSAWFIVDDQGAMTPTTVTRSEAPATSPSSRTNSCRRPLDWVLVTGAASPSESRVATHVTDCRITGGLASAVRLLIAADEIRD